MSASTQPISRFLKIGLWIGLVYGFAEAVYVCIMAQFDGVLGWRTGDSWPILLVAPAVYALLFLIPALVAALGARLLPRLRWDVALVFVLVGLSAYFAATTQGRLFRPLSALMLSLGVGVAVTRAFIARRERWWAAMARALPRTAILIFAAGGMVVLAARLYETYRISRLPDAPAQAPNVLLLVMDTQRADHLSVYGYPRPTSPRLAQLAEQGVLFTEAHSPASWTLPSHATMLTGLRPGLHHAGENGLEYLDRKFTTLAEALSDNGYATGGFVGNVFWTGRHTRLNQGFTRYEDYNSNLGDALSRTTVGRWFAYERLPKFGFVNLPGRKSAGDVNAEFLGWVSGIKGRPFFGFLNYMDVHGPYIAPAPFAGRFTGSMPSYRATSIELGGFDETGPSSPAELERRRAEYDECVSYLDASIGALLDSLAARKLLDNTVVIVTSDHGEGFGEHNMMYHGRSLYLDQITVPLIIRYPARFAGGTRVTGPVGLDRIPATVASLTGLDSRLFPGDDLFAASERHLAVVSEVPYRKGNKKTSQAARGWIKSFRTERWHLLTFERGSAELYDIRLDPAELTNLAGNPALADTLVVLRAGLARALNSAPESTLAIP